MAEHRRLRPAGFDDLGLRRALGDRLLPLLVAAMTFLAALAIAGAVGAAALAEHWRAGAATAVTVQVPQPAAAASPPLTASRIDAVATLLRGSAEVASVRVLGDGELADLLRPWLGSGAERLSLPLPAVVAVHTRGDGTDLAPLAERLRAAAPGTLIEGHGVWVGRLTALARSLEACTLAVLAVVAAVAASVVTVATRAGLAARREAIEIVHGLGATDGYIAGRFARRAMRLAAKGGLFGALAALPVLIGLADLAAPFASGAADALAGPRPWWQPLAAVPPILWASLPALPLAAATLGFATAWTTVRRWLRRLP